MEGDLLGTRIPWGQLTSLHLGTRIGIILARDILARCAALTTCILSNVEPVDEGDADELPPLAACVLPDLTSLTVALDPHDEGPISPLFQPFSFPALISLDIAAYGCPVDALLDLHARSAFPLTRLDLTNAELDAADLLAFLRLIPTLAELALARCECVADALFAAFTCPTPCSSSTSAPQLTLPLLTSLSLEQDAGSLDGDVVAEMVASLWRAAERGDTPFPLLKCVELELTGMRFSDAAERRLAEVAAAGFLVDRQERE
ncbi:hypothetical protein DFH09DRAFT_1197330 [Mycena vulgaris]|nr:hypothetical protein DFH09DRAFT_1197330 [Mycena vulgaris]